MATKVDLTGRRFGRLVVIEEMGRRREPSGRTVIVWRALCDCGKTTVIPGQAMACGNTRSCGCLKSEVTSARAKKDNVRHGKSAAPVYYVWRSMLSRCYRITDGSYHRYGARGVRVCDRWNPRAGGCFENFLADMGEPAPGMTLDKDKRGGRGCKIYSPETCCWLHIADQQLYRRDNRLVTINGITKPLAAWSRESGLNPQTLRGRVVAGWADHLLLVPAARRSKGSA